MIDLFVSLYGRYEISYNEVSRYSVFSGFYRYL